MDTIVIMNNKVFVDITKNKDQLLRKLSGSDFQKLVREAEKIWVDYEPIEDRSTTSVAIDGGMNFQLYQGLTAYIVNSAVVYSNGSLVQGVGKNDTGLDWDYDVAARNKEHIQNLMLLCEVRLLTDLLNFDFINNRVKTPDLILVDGSIASWFTSGIFKGKSYKEAQEDRENFFTVLLSNKDWINPPKSLIFISKSSDTPVYFKEDVTGENKIGDIYYFNKMRNSKAGYSKPAIRKYSFSGKPIINIITFFARLKKDTPIFKFELVDTSGSSLSKERLDMLEHSIIPKILNRLVFHSVKGYPYALVLAHQNASVTEADKDRFIRLLGFQNEMGARVALE